MSVNCKSGLQSLHPVKPKIVDQLPSFLLNGHNTKFPSKFVSLYQWTSAALWPQQRSFFMQCMVANNIKGSSKMPVKCPATNETSISDPYPQAQEPQWKKQVKYSKSQRLRSIRKKAVSSGHDRTLDSGAQNNYDRLLKTCRRSSQSFQMEREGVHELPFLAEVLWQVDRFWGRVSFR